jgi:hypothetical protein
MEKLEELFLRGSVGLWSIRRPPLLPLLAGEGVDGSADSKEDRRSLRDLAGADHGDGCCDVDGDSPIVVGITIVGS